MAYKNLIATMQALTEGPCDIPTLMSKVGICRSRMYVISRNFQRLGLIRMHSYRYEGKQRWTIFELSDGTPDMQIRSKLNAQSIGFANLWKALAHPCTTNDLVEIVGYGPRQTQTIIAKMRKAKLIHICSWDVAGDSPVAEYQRGDKEDVKKPKAMKREEINRRWREARKAMNLHNIINGLAAA